MVTGGDRVLSERMWRLGLVDTDDYFVIVT
jgi:hypothetical protein